MTKPTCYHHDKNVVWTTVSADNTPLVMRQLRHQCIDCGRLLTNALPHSMATKNTPNVDLDFLQRWIDYDKQQWEQRGIESKFISQKRREEQLNFYHGYLNSQAWFERRKLVMERAGGLCEGCRQRPATQVHHLTYEHVGCEMLWELVAVCRNCHERVHDISKIRR